MSQITEENRIAFANYARECLFEQIYCSHYLLLKNIDVNFYIEKLAERFFQKTGKSFPNTLYDEIYECFSGMYLTAQTDALYKRIEDLFVNFDKKNQFKVMKKVEENKKVESLNSLSDSAKLYIERKSHSISIEKYEQLKLEAIAQNAKDVIQFEKNCRRYKYEVFKSELAKEKILLTYSNDRKMYSLKIHESIYFFHEINEDRCLFVNECLVSILNADIISHENFVKVMFNFSLIKQIRSNVK